MLRRQDEDETRRIAAAPDDDLPRGILVARPSQRGFEICKGFEIACFFAEVDDGFIFVAPHFATVARINRKTAEVGGDKARGNRSVFPTIRPSLMEQKDDRSRGAARGVVSSEDFHAVG